MQDDAGVCIENIDLRHLVIEHTIAVMCLLMGRILILWVDYLVIYIFGTAC